MSLSWLWTNIWLLGSFHCPLAGTSAHFHRSQPCSAVTEKPPTRVRRTRGTKERPLPWVQPLLQQQKNPDVYSNEFLAFTITKSNSKDLRQTKNTTNIKLWRKHFKSYQPLNASLNRWWCSPAAVPTPTGICWRCHQATSHTNSSTLQRKISWPCDQVQKEGGPGSQSKAD